MHLSKNGSTRAEFERREQKGVLGPDRDLYGKGKTRQHRGMETQRKSRGIFF